MNLSTNCITLLCIHLLFCLSVKSQNAGSLDPSFGNGGTVVTQLGPGDHWAHSILVQPDQKIVIDGVQQIASQPGILVRLNTDGSLDSSFGNNGVANNNISFLILPMSTGQSLAIQPDGKLISVWGTYSTPVITRFNTDGTLDTSFGSGGNAQHPQVTQWPKGTFIVALQNDGKILFGGYDLVGVDYYETLVVRLNEDGTIESTFNGDGLLSYEDIGLYNNPLIQEAIVKGIGLQSDGTIIILEETSTIFNNPPYAVLLGLNPDGNFKSSFGDNGISYVPIYPSWSEDGFAIPGGMVVKPDDKIIVCGASRENGSWETFLLGLNPDGQPDNTFGTGGLTFTNLSHEYRRAQSVVLDTSGKVLVGGWYKTASADTVGMVIRYNSNGTPDSIFGTNGVVTLTGNMYFGSDINVQDDNKILIAGTYDSGTTDGLEFVASRLLSELGTGIESLQNTKPAIDLTPNPASDNLDIELINSLFEIKSLTVFDLAGKVMVQKSGLSTRKTVIPIKQFEEGMYVLRLEINDGSNISRQFVISR
jgi:uncharacterized delta-60 repeat protein